MRANCWLLVLFLIAGQPANAQPPPRAYTIQLIEQGRQALLADQYVEAGKSLEAAIRSEAFAAIDPEAQYRAFVFASLAASGREDYLGAHEFMMAATHFSEATPAQWLLRARYASWVDAWADAGASITKVAQLWPAELQNEDENRFASRVAWQMVRDPASRPQLLALLNALFAANFTVAFAQQPSGLWQELILEALEKEDLARAREIVARVDDTDTLLGMRIDKRFAALMQAEPKRFDLDAAMKHRSKVLEKIVVGNPRKLKAFVAYGYALLDEGRHAEVLERSDAILKKVASSNGKKSLPYDDLDDSLSWVYNHKAAALRALGRWNDALAVMEQGRLKVEDGSNNVSQAINLGFHYNDAGQPAKALQVLDGIDWARSLSPYGRMQLQHVRYRAYLQLGNEAEAGNVLAYLRQHHDDAEDTWLLAMLDSGDMDGAAELMISQLKDPQKRGTALRDAQEYRSLPLQPRMEDARVRWETLVTRPDVLAAINEVGRREKVPIYESRN
jgi:hypothetical protein